MAEDINEWLNRLKGIDRRTIIKWVTDVSGRALSKSELEKYMLERYDVTKSQTDEKIEAFADKWLIDPLTGERLDESVSEIEDEGPNDEVDAELLKELDEEEPDEPDEPEVPNEPEEPEEIEERGRLPSELRQGVRESPEATQPVIPSDSIPFKNPSMAEPNGEPEQRQRPLGDYARVRTPIKPPEEFITRKVTASDWDKAMDPFNPYFDILRRDSGLLVQIAQKSDMRNHAPYLQMRSILINNEVKDANNTTAMVSTIDENKQLVQRHTPLPQIRDISRLLAEQGYLQAAINNFDTLEEARIKREQNLVALIYLLEIYCESKQQSPLEFNIPRQKLASIVEDSFKEIKNIITGMVMMQLQQMRTELKGEMVDVSKVMESNMGSFGNQISDAVERVVWKVKTDVEATNLEDIKRAISWVLNKSEATYQQGTGPVATMTVLLNDLLRRLINENFKIDSIKEFRHYTTKEISKKLGHKGVTIVNESVRKAGKNKSLIVYGDGTFSLSR